MSFKKRDLGAVFSEINCGKFREIYTVSPQKLPIMKELILKGRGLGILFHTFPGKLEKGDELRHELGEYLEEGRVNFIQFTINEEHCQRLQQFMQEYENLKVAKNWGLPHRPRQGEGGTSPALAYSLLQVLGFGEEIFREGWMRQLIIPMEYAGPPLKEDTVGILKLFSIRWGNTDEPHVLLNLWDKEKMHTWIGLNVKNFKNAHIGSLTGILMERAHFPAPKEPVWLKQTDLKQ